jgi:hypothetical protein
MWDVRAVTDLANCERTSYNHSFFIQLSSFTLFRAFPHLPSFSPSLNSEDNVITGMRLGEFWGILHTKMKCVHVKISSSHATVVAPGSR